MRRHPSPEMAEMPRKWTRGNGGNATEMTMAEMSRKCRPPGNRDPELDEQHACRPFLLGQIEAIQPKVIVTLGRTATQTVMETNERISRMRGRWAQHPHCDVAVMPTYHPAAILRNRQLRRPVWEDLQLAMDRLGLPRNP